MPKTKGALMAAMIKEMKHMKKEQLRAAYNAMMKPEGVHDKPDMEVTVYDVAGGGGGGGGSNSSQSAESKQAEEARQKEVQRYLSCSQRRWALH